MPELPLTLPGEDRAFGGNNLFVDLVPKTAWFTNVRSQVSRADWDLLRKHIYARAGHRCEVCGATGRLEAHERWDYFRNVQTLKRLIALCPACHEATHFGLAEVRGRDRAALAHLMQVNDWSRVQALDHVDRAFLLWAERSKQKWDIDLGMLLAVGIKVKNLPTAAEREEIADNALKGTK